MSKSEESKLDNLFETLTLMIQKKSSFDQIRGLFPIASELKNVKDLVNNKYKRKSIFLESNKILLTIALENLKGEDLLSMVKLLMDCGSDVTVDVWEALLSKTQIYRNDILKILLNSNQNDLLPNSNPSDNIQILQKLIDLRTPFEIVEQLVNNVEKIEKTMTFIKESGNSGPDSCDLIDYAYNLEKPQTHEQKLIDDANNSEQPPTYGRKLIELFISKGALVTSLIIRECINRESRKWLIRLFDPNDISKYCYEEDVGRSLVKFILQKEIEVHSTVFEEIKVLDRRNRPYADRTLQYIFITKSLLTLKISENKNHVTTYKFMKDYFFKVISLKSLILIEEISGLILKITDTHHYWPQVLELILRRDGCLTRDRLELFIKNYPFLKQEFFKKIVELNILHFTNNLDLEIPFTKFVSMEAPLELMSIIIAILKKHDDRNYLVITLLKESLTRKNSKYVMKIVDLFAPIPDANGFFLKYLYGLYSDKENDDNIEFKNSLVSITPILQPTAFSDAIYMLDKLLPPLTWYHSCVNIYLDHLVKMQTLFPSVLLNIIVEYLKIDPASFLIEVLHADYQNSNSKIMFRQLPVPKQPPDLGFCAHYALFNALLPGLFITGNHKIMADLFHSKAEVSQNREFLTNHFLNITARMKQGEEDLSPAPILIEFDHKTAPFQPIYEATSKYTDSNPFSPVPIDYKMSKIGEMEPVLKLNLITNLINLFFRFESGLPILTFFLACKDNEHWLNLIWLAQKDIFNACLFMDSIQTPNYRMDRFFAPIQKILSDFNELIEIVEDTLNKTYQEFKFLNTPPTTIDSGILRQVKALLECWCVLLKQPKLKKLVNWDHYLKIKSIIKPYLDLKESNHIKKIIEEIEPEATPTTSKLTLTFLDEAKKIHLSGILKSNCLNFQSRLT